MTDAEQAAVEYMLENVMYGLPGAGRFNEVRDALLKERQSSECVVFLTPFRRSLEEARLGWKEACSMARERFGQAAASASIDTVMEQERPHGTR